LDELLMAAQDCKKAALEAGCFARFDAAHAAYAARYAVLAATPNPEPNQAGAGDAVAEAAANHAANWIETDQARATMRLACSYVVRNRILDSIILSAWRARFRGVSH
jgi:hypothetical protein